MGAHDYLRFTRKERSGISVLILLMVLLAAGTRYWWAPAAPDLGELAADRLQLGRDNKGPATDRLAAPTTGRGMDSGSGAPSGNGAESGNEGARRSGAAYPGRYTAEGLAEPGGGQAGSRRAYSTAGGRGKKAAAKSFRTGERRAYSSAYSRKILPVMDINKADTAAFIALPGIGPVLAARIVLFREKLGGFHNVSQIGEVYGLPDSVFRRIGAWLKCDSPSIRRLPLNTVDKEILARHPYLGWAGARAIVNYRRQHGPFRSLEALARIFTLDTAVFKRIKPYLYLD